MNGKHDYSDPTSNLVIYPTEKDQHPIPPRVTHYVVAFRRKGSWGKWNIATDCRTAQEAKDKADRIRKDPKDPNWEVEVWLVHPMPL
jgi:hypothetical protein